MQIVLIKLQNRIDQAVELQKVLTNHGCNIQLRLGLHETADQICAQEGVILLQVKAEAKAVKKLVSDCQAIKGAKIKAVEI